jgi:hypothetical protein
MATLLRSGTSSCSLAELLCQKLDGHSRLGAWEARQWCLQLASIYWSYYHTVCFDKADSHYRADRTFAHYTGAHRVPSINCLPWLAASACVAAYCAVLELLLHSQYGLYELPSPGSLPIHRLKSRHSVPRPSNMPRSLSKCPRWQNLFRRGR